VTAPLIDSSGNPQVFATGTDYTHTCSHNSDEEQKKETKLYYENLQEAEESLMGLPDAFAKLEQGLFLTI